MGTIGIVQNKLVNDWSQSNLDSNSNGTITLSLSSPERCAPSGLIASLECIYLAPLDGQTGPNWSALASSHSFECEMVSKVKRVVCSRHDRRIRPLCIDLSPATKFQFLSVPSDDPSETIERIYLVKIINGRTLMQAMARNSSRPDTAGRGKRRRRKVVVSIENVKC